MKFPKTIFSPEKKAKKTLVSKKNVEDDLDENKEDTDILEEVTSVLEEDKGVLEEDRRILEETIPLETPSQDKNKATRKKLSKVDISFANVENMDENVEPSFKSPSKPVSKRRLRRKRAVKELDQEMQDLLAL